MENNIKAEVIKVDGLSFTIAPFFAKEAIRIKVKLIGKILPILSSFADGVEGKQLDDFDLGSIKLSGNVLSRAFSVLSDTLSEDEIEALIDRLLSKTYYNDSAVTDEGTFNILFMKNTMRVYKLIFEVIKFNYPDFLLMGERFGLKSETSILKRAEKKA